MQQENETVAYSGYAQCIHLLILRMRDFYFVDD